MWRLEQDQMKLLSGLLGEQGADALQMIGRIERLNRLLGKPETEKQPDQVHVPEIQSSERPESIFNHTKDENILFAAIPFLDLEYQKNIFVAVRLMELQRVMGSTLLETREKQEAPAFRRHKMLQAVRPYLANAERAQLDRMLKMMDIKEVFERNI